MTCREGTSDYEWALQRYLEAAVPPATILTDADPGCTAAIATVFPRAKHLWCLWHIHQNLRRNLLSKLGVEYGRFCAQFKSAQQQVCKTVRVMHAMYRASDNRSMALIDCAYVAGL